jgi:hypothetical protein
MVAKNDSPSHTRATQENFNLAMTNPGANESDSAPFKYPATQIEAPISKGDPSPEHKLPSQGRQRMGAEMPLRGINAVFKAPVD